MPARRRITRTYTVPPLKQGFAGHGHLAAPVLRADEWPLNDPFIMLMDDHLDMGERQVGGCLPPSRSSGELPWQDRFIRRAGVGRAAGPGRPVGRIFRHVGASEGCPVAWRRGGPPGASDRGRTPRPVTRGVYAFHRLGG